MPELPESLEESRRKRADIVRKVASKFIDRSANVTEGLAPAEIYSILQQEIEALNLHSEVEKFRIMSYLLVSIFEANAQEETPGFAKIQKSVHKAAELVVKQALLQIEEIKNTMYKEIKNQITIQGSGISKAEQQAIWYNFVTTLRITNENIDNMTHDYAYIMTSINDNNEGTTTKEKTMWDKHKEDKCLKNAQKIFNKIMLSYAQQSTVFDQKILTDLAHKEVNALNLDNKYEWFVVHSTALEMVLTQQTEPQGSRFKEAITKVAKNLDPLIAQGLSQFEEIKATLYQEIKDGIAKEVPNISPVERIVIWGALIREISHAIQYIGTECVYPSEESNA